MIQNLNILALILIVAIIIIRLYGLSVATLISTLITNIILLYVYFSGVLSSPSATLVIKKAVEDEAPSKDSTTQHTYDTFVSGGNNEMMGAAANATIDDMSALMAGSRSCVDKIIERGSSIDFKKAAMQYGPELIASEAQHWWGNNE